MHNPARTLRIAGPLALATVTVAYLLCNVAYFAAASKAEIVGSGRLVAALLFRNVWGERAERVLSAFVALSALGNILSVVCIFSDAQGSSTDLAEFRSSLKAESTRSSARRGCCRSATFGSRTGRRRRRLRDSLFVRNLSAKIVCALTCVDSDWIICNIVIFALPAGDAYNFVINVVRIFRLCSDYLGLMPPQISYPLAVINSIISFGLVCLALRDTDAALPFLGSRRRAVKSPVVTSSTPLLSAPASTTNSTTSLDSDRSPSPTFLPTPSLLYPALLFGIANIFLFLVPLLPPPAGVKLYEHLPYWAHVIGGWAVSGIGAAWWSVRERKRV